MLRFFKLAHQAHGIAMIISTIFKILPTLGNMAILALIVTFIFGIAATSMFAVGGIAGVHYTMGWCELRCLHHAWLGSGCCLTGM